jgi:hypothetical protein
LDLPVADVLPVGTEVIIRRLQNGAISEAFKNMKRAPEIGFIFGRADSGEYVVGLMKSKEVLLVPEGYFSVSIRRYSGPTRRAPMLEVTDDGL